MQCMYYVDGHTRCHFDATGVLIIRTEGEDEEYHLCGAHQLAMKTEYGDAVVEER